MNQTGILTKMVCRARAWSGLTRWRERRAQGSVILCYHGVQHQIGRSYLDRYAISASLLHQQLRMLAKTYTPASLETVLESIDNRDTSHRFIAMVFDDGLLNQTELAASVLAEEGWPWALAICPGLVGSRRSIWSYELAFILQQWWPDGPFPLPPGLGPDLRLRGLESREAALHLLRQHLLYKCNSQQRIDYLETLVERGGRQEFEQALASDRRFALAGWDRIKTLAADGVSILSHGFLHRPQNLAIEPGALQEEFQLSRRIIQEQIGKAPEALVLPHGILHEDSAKLTNAAGYRFCLTMQAGRIGAQTSAFAVPRYSASYSCVVLRHSLVTLGVDSHGLAS